MHLGHVDVAGLHRNSKPITPEFHALRARNPTARASPGDATPVQVLSGQDAMKAEDAKPQRSGTQMLADWCDESRE